jgi:VIT1/CCC1 family predicted Fe2+/Mn2+ transporter
MSHHDDHEAEHTPEAIRERIEGAPSQGYLKDSIYGAIDGAVTTFAVVSSVAGAGLASGIVIILGIANLLADGFSMASGNFLGTRAENQAARKARREEEEEIEKHPEGEREEIRQIFAAKGFEGETLEKVVSVITSDKRRWVDVMLHEEHGVTRDRPSALKAAFATFAAFLVIGAIPLASYILNIVDPELMPEPFLPACLLTGVAFFAVGALKGRFVDQHWALGGAETLSVGALAAGIAYAIGVLLRPLAEGL